MKTTLEELRILKWCLYTSPITINQIKFRRFALTEVSCQPVHGPHTWLHTVYFYGGINTQMQMRLHNFGKDFSVSERLCDMWVWLLNMGMCLLPETADLLLRVVCKWSVRPLACVCLCWKAKYMRVTYVILMGMCGWVGLGRGSYHGACFCLCTFWFSRCQTDPLASFPPLPLPNDHEQGRLFCLTSATAADMLQDVSEVLGADNRSPPSVIRVVYRMTASLSNSPPLPSLLSLLSARPWVLTVRTCRRAPA